MEFLQNRKNLLVNAFKPVVRNQTTRIRRLRRALIPEIQKLLDADRGKAVVFEVLHLPTELLHGHQVGGGRFNGVKDKAVVAKNVEGRVSRGGRRRGGRSGLRDSPSRLAGRVRGA